MAATTTKVLCMALVLPGARAAAINAAAASRSAPAQGGFPLSSLLPFLHVASKDEAPKDAAKNAAAKDDVAKDGVAKDGNTPAAARKKAPKADAKPARASVVEAHEGLEAPLKASTNVLVASTSRASKPPTKSAHTGTLSDTIDKLIQKKEALLRRSSIALENYARAFLDAQNTDEAQRMAKISEEHAEASVESELAKLRDAKRELAGDAKKELNSSPLEASYSAAQNQLIKAEQRVATAEGRVSIESRRATSFEKELEEATSRMEKSWGEKNKYAEEVKVLLAQALELATQLKDAEERHELQMHTLEFHAKELETEDAALLAAISDAKKAIKGQRPKIIATAANKDFPKKGARSKTKEAVPEQDAPQKGARSEAKVAVPEQEAPKTGARSKAKEAEPEQDSPKTGARSEAKEAEPEQDSPENGARRKAKEAVPEEDSTETGSRSDAKAAEPEQDSPETGVRRKGKEALFEQDLLDEDEDEEATGISSGFTPLQGAHEG